MKIDLSNFDKNELKRYNWVKNMTKKDLLKIQAKWAVEKDIDKALNPILILEPFDYEIIFVNTKKLIEQIEFLGLDYSRLITDDDLDYRYVDIVERWESGKFIDPASIYYDDRREVFAASDGRHRLITAYHIGEKTVPIAVSPNRDKSKFELLV